MTNAHDDEQLAAYLWDPSAPEAPDVAAVERRLEALRFDADAPPLRWSRTSSISIGWRRRSSDRRAARLSSRRRWIYRLAAAAAVIVVAGGALAAWRWSWPAGRAWSIDPGPGTSATQLVVGTPLALSGPEGATIAIARVGTMHAEGDARLVLRSTQGTRHRLALDAGTIHVRMWAPPGTLSVATPAGDVIDLGCEFDLTAGPDRSIVRVRSGWVQIENGLGESLIPAGATGDARVGSAPSVPVFDDAAPGFTTNVRALESRAGDPAALATAIVAAARPRDVLTLLLLAARGMPESERLLRRAAELWPPPADVTVAGILRGDRAGLWRWYETLPLPPTKSWLRNWRDGLPSWLR